MQQLKQNVINTWGDKGKLWLEQLSSIIQSLSNGWSLTNIQPVDNMRYNYVARALQHDKTPVILKISCDMQLSADEHHALRYFDGHGAIRVYAVNSQYNALLLQQAMPGLSLKNKT